MDNESKTEVIQEALEVDESIEAPIDLCDDPSQEQIKKRSQRLYKRILPIMAIILVAMILITAVLSIVLRSLQDDDTNPTYRPVDYPIYGFYPVYNGNIFENEEYLAFNRDIHYYDNLQGYGERYVISENTTDKKFKLIYSCLQSIMQGDENAYNSLFNQTYYQAHEKQPAFEQQMLYEICIYFYSQESLSNGENLYTYQVDYMIYQNNGTYRQDIGSDMIRSQYLVLHEYADGSVDIENLVTKRMAVKVE